MKDLLRENLAVVFMSAPGCYLMLSGAFYWQNNMKTTGRPREHVRDVIWWATESSGAGCTTDSWVNVTVFNPENGQIGETSIWDRVEAKTVEERTQ